MATASKPYDNLNQGDYWVDRSANIRIHYVTAQAKLREMAPTKADTIVLLHGFPQTSYQFRHVIPLLTDAGFDVVAPDYRGAGQSSHPSSADFTKAAMAEDIFKLVHDHLGVKHSVHVVGNDIGGMVAYAYALRYPHHVRCLVWGECPLPGTAVWERHMRDPTQFHFQFHCAPQLAGALVAGRERIYIKHFFDKLALENDKAPAISEEDLARYVTDYSQPEAMKCAFATYAAFSEDAEDNKASWKGGKLCTSPTLLLNGSESRHAAEAREMLAESGVETSANEISVVEQSGHYIAEENPEGFCGAILSFLQVNRQRSRRSSSERSSKATDKRKVDSKRKYHTGSSKNVETTMSNPE